MTISSCIVFIFTFLLFLSGYVLQQQTVRNLQAVIKPPPRPTPTPTPESFPYSPPLTSLEIEDPSDARGHHVLGSFFSGAASGALGRKFKGKMAFVQVVTDHMQICNAVMLFASLERSKSRAERVLLYPAAWTEDGAARTARGGSRHVETTKRLLNIAAKRYDVMIRSVPSLPESGDGTLSTAALGHLLSMTRYKRLLYLAPSGLLLNPARLESFVLESSLDQAIATLPAIDQISASQPPSLMMIEPSEAEHARVNAILSSTPSLRSSSSSSSSPSRQLLALLKRHYISSTLSVASSFFYASGADSDEDSPLLLHTSTLRSSPPSNLNASMAMKSTGYIHMQHSSPFTTTSTATATDEFFLPGPEYDIPRSTLTQARPDHTNPEGQRLWDAAYERFREDRMAVCGLDLEPWVGPALRPSPARVSSDVSEEMPETPDALTGRRGRRRRPNDLAQDANTEVDGVGDGEDEELRK
ncbi:MAG: hypothetical protein M1838_006079 [Thelocarpon superellum]|nr:MAG: hypothetical protein M1838_006079 [Thelocarpon superellum]